MSYATAHELALIEPVETLITRMCHRKADDYELSRRLLSQAAAARLGNLPFGDLLSIVQEPVSEGSASFAWEQSAALVTALEALPMPPPLSVVSLMRSQLDDVARRRSGSYLTDFRLSTLLMHRLVQKVSPGSCILDPAVGTGSFLVAFALEASRSWGKPIKDIVGCCLYGADFSLEAVNGTLCALAAAGADIRSLEEARTHLRVEDSLILGKDLWKDFVQGFDCVVGNPPWEKLKLSRHEYLKGLGLDRHYGSDYDVPEHALLLDEKYIHSRSSVDQYKRTLRSKFAMQGNGEEDLYKLFLELSLALVKPQGGYISMLVPAGLVRSSGSEALRRHLFWGTEELGITIFFNKAKFFEIDSRFKFVAVEAKTGAGLYRPIELSLGLADDHAAYSNTPVTLERTALATIRPDLAIPEVRSDEEWSLFHHIASVADPFGASGSPWRPHIVREIDMTRDRRHFREAPGEGMLPVLEGRMIHQHRHNAKGYGDGTGRAAVWHPLPMSCTCEIRPQFWYPENELPESIRTRIRQLRTGFCDITGQTNERTLLAASIPAGTVCGNKVPTITFAENSDWIYWLWLAYANSFLVDWMLRRITTTTVNYFILRSLPLPSPTSNPEREHILAALSRKLACSTHAGGKVGELTPAEIAETRAEIEWRALDAYGLDASVLGIISTDFPLLDRGEPPLTGERQSTVTMDLVGLRAMQNLGGRLKQGGHLMSVDELEERLATALDQGARAFRPSQLSIAVRCGAERTEAEEDSINGTVN